MEHRPKAIIQAGIDITGLHPAVLEAGRAIMQIKEKGVTARYKADASPVTEADERAEQILLSALLRAYPDIPIISEENPESHKLTPESLYFLVDPLDGTRDFLRADSKGAFSVNIGLIKDGQAVAGIIYAPMLDWLCWGGLDAGGFQDRNGKCTPLGIRSAPPEGPVALTSRSHRDPKTDAFLSAQNISETIYMGSSLKFALLACGQADIYPRFEPCMEWDTAAGEAILSSAGGQMFDADGNPHRYGKPGWKNRPFIACAGFCPYDKGAGG